MGPHEADEIAQQGAFPAAAAAENDEDFAPLDREVDAVEHGSIAVLHHEVLYFDDIFAVIRHDLGKEKGRPD